MSLLALASCAGDFPARPAPTEVTYSPPPPFKPIPVAADLPGKAVTPIVGEPITAVKIRYVGPATVEEARIRGHIGTRVGEPYSPGRVDEDIKNLYEGGNIDDVRVLAESAGEGLQIIYEVTTRNPPITMGLPALFAGNRAFPVKRLEKESGLSSAIISSPHELAAGRDKLKKFYRAQGFSRSEVEVTWSGSYFSIQIEEGPRAQS